MGVLHLFSVNYIFYDKTDLKLIFFSYDDIQIYACDIEYYTNQM